MRDTTFDRLRAIVAESKGARPAQARDALPRAAIGSERPSLDDAVRVLGGTVAPASDTPSMVVARSYASGSRYGSRRLGDYPRPSDAGLALLAGHCAESPSDAMDADESAGAETVFFDLETTGLSGGAGTIPFIIGLGWFTSRGFETCQYFLPSPAAERHALERVAGVLDRARTLVTFNGRSFDGPMTEMRYAFHRCPSPLERMLHVDLLHPSRHLWSGEEGRLVSLERDVLRMHRSGDVPGAEIPGRYHEFLRHGDAALLAPVLEHNRLDLVSLGVLTGFACALVREGPTATAGASQAYGLGRLFEKVGRESDAIQCYRQAVGPPAAHVARTRHLSSRRRSRAVARADGEARLESLARLGTLYRRQRRYAEAAEIWARLLSAPGLTTRLRREATVALAVHYEHRDRNLLAAHGFARQALVGVQSRTLRHAVEHRLTRLNKKLRDSRGDADGVDSGFDW